MEEAARKRLWVDYARTKDPGIREKIILEYAPLVKVEATKFTEVGYVGRDVDSMVRDLVEASIRLCKDKHNGTKNG